jgi:hypothetical protein
MIKFSFTNHAHLPLEEWIELNAGASAYSVRFDGIIYMINNVVYNERTPAFIEAFNKERVWEALKEQ